MTPEERAAYARQILDDLYEHDTDQRPFQVQLAIAEALTAIAQAMTYVPRIVLPESEVDETVRRVREENPNSGPFLGWVQ